MRKLVVGLLLLSLSVPVFAKKPKKTSNQVCAERDRHGKLKKKVKDQDGKRVRREHYCDDPPPKPRD